MDNPILAAMNSPKPANNPMAMIQQFAEFKRRMAGKDPQAILNELLSTGKMSQQQFEQLKQQAQSLQNILK